MRPDVWKNVYTQFIGASIDIRIWMVGEKELRLCESVYRYILQTKA